jgi:hypothetical protein
VKTYTVICNCPTPLVDNHLTVQAEDEKQAKELFFTHNGITGTVHPIEITEGEVVKKPVRRKPNERSDNAGGDQK